MGRFLWICVGGVLYAYGFYPLVIWSLARAFGKQRQPRGSKAAEWPSVSLVIAAYNEKAVIEERICNALALDYPADKLEILIASDGSSDATGDIVRRYVGSGVRLLTRNAHDWAPRYPLLSRQWRRCGCAPVCSTGRRCIATRTAWHCLRSCASAAMTHRIADRWHMWR